MLSIVLDTWSTARALFPLLTHCLLFTLFTDWWQLDLCTKRKSILRASGVKSQPSVSETERREDWESTQTNVRALRCTDEVAADGKVADFRENALLHWRLTSSCRFVKYAWNNCSVGDRKFPAWYLSRPLNEDLNRGAPALYLSSAIARVPRHSTHERAHACD